jgi:hypothetical protein
VEDGAVAGGDEAGGQVAEAAEPLVGRGENGTSVTRAGRSEQVGLRDAVLVELLHRHVHELVRHAQAGAPREARLVGHDHRMRRQRAQTPLDARVETVIAARAREVPGADEEDRQRDEPCEHECARRRQPQRGEQRERHDELAHVRSPHRRLGEQDAHLRHEPRTQRGPGAPEAGPLARDPPGPRGHGEHHDNERSRDDHRVALHERREHAPHRLADGVPARLVVVADRLVPHPRVAPHTGQHDRDRDREHGRRDHITRATARQQRERHRHHDRRGQQLHRARRADEETRAGRARSRRTIAVRERDGDRGGRACDRRAVAADPRGHEEQRAARRCQRGRDHAGAPSGDAPRDQVRGDGDHHRGNERQQPRRVLRAAAQEVGDEEQRVVERPLRGEHVAVRAGAVPHRDRRLAVHAVVEAQVA